MSWSRPFAALGLALALLAAGCGFEPVHKPSGGLAERLQNVYVVPIKSHTGQAVRNALLDELGAPDRNADADYILTLSVSEVRESLGIQADETVSRINVIITASYVLTLNDIERTVIGRGSVTRSAPFNVVDDEFSTQTASRDAQRLAGRQVGEAIRRRVSVQLRQ
ncbi:MAG: LPS assembly lipoprotein LptE [Minwuia sp.]|uniref:LPS assembly lipoprotein LptE n=1 Tax=Minwuia sp. TaxID=2493630 RepID=UPI003A85EC05